MNLCKAFHPALNVSTDGLLVTYCDSRFGVGVGQRLDESGLDSAESEIFAALEIDAIEVNVIYC